jgi:hypothetical protein
MLRVKRPQKIITPKAKERQKSREMSSPFLSLKETELETANDEVVPKPPHLSGNSKIWESYTLRIRYEPVVVPISAQLLIIWAVSVLESWYQGDIKLIVYSVLGRRKEKSSLEEKNNY